MRGAEASTFDEVAETASEEGMDRVIEAGVDACICPTFIDSSNDVWSIEIVKVLSFSR